jgi:hypothetical protein
MAKFAITWSLGRVEEVLQEAASSVEEFVNIHFGSAWAEAQAAGVTVEHLLGEFLGEIAPPAEQTALTLTADTSAPSPEGQPVESPAPAEPAPALSVESGQTQQP